MTADRHDPLRTRRVLPLGLALSTALHALMLMLRIAAPHAPQPVRTSTVARQDADALLVLDIRPVAGAPAGYIARVRTPDVTTPAQRAVVAPAPTAEGAPAAAPDRLWTPRLDARLSTGAPAADVDAIATVRARVAIELEAYNDSVAAATEAARRSNDWTRRGTSGARWGISPDTIHLGHRTIRLRECPASGCSEPFLTPPPGRRDEQRERIRAFTELRAQASRIEQQQAFAARVRDIRQRADAARDSARTRGR